MNCRNCLRPMAEHPTIECLYRCRNAYCANFDCPTYAPANPLAPAELSPPPAPTSSETGSGDGR